MHVLKGCFIPGFLSNTIAFNIEVRARLKGKNLNGYAIFCFMDYL
jgi:hypothetical protein